MLSLYILIFFFLIFHYIHMKLRNSTIMKNFIIHYLFIFFSCNKRVSTSITAYTGLCEVWRNIDRRNCLINMMKPYRSYRYEQVCWAHVFISYALCLFLLISTTFQSLLKLKLLRISSPTLSKMQLQLNIYSWRTSSWGRQRDLLSGSSGFHRGGWRLRATSSAEIFARALINYSINPPGILLARCPGESSPRLQFYHLINGGVSFGWLDSRRGRLLE